MKSFRKELFESIETFEDAKYIVSEWLMGGIELETAKLKLYENMYLVKNATDILDLRNSIIEKVNVALQSISKVTITESDSVMTETYNKSIKNIEESIDRSLSRNEGLVWKIINVLNEFSLVPKMKIVGGGMGNFKKGAIVGGVGLVAAGLYAAGKHKQVNNEIEEDEEEADKSTEQSEMVQEVIKYNRAKGIKGDLMPTIGQRAKLLKKAIKTGAQNKASRAGIAWKVMPKKAKAAVAIGTAVAGVYGAKKIAKKIAANKRIKTMIQNEQ